MDTFVKKQIHLILFILLTISAYGQDCDTCKVAYKFKLDYDIPESPAFSVLDANPSTVMRGSAAKEFALNVANNFISNSRQESGIAADFNPYFVFGGRFKNINDYKDSKNYFNRLLANTSLSFASIQTDQFPNDNLFSGGLRITLFDAADLLNDDELGKDIDNELDAPELEWDSNDDGTIKTTQILNKERFAIAYQKAKERARNKQGGALSIGAATSQRGLGGKISADSLIHFRSQIWLSGQYNFGHGWNMLGLAMNRNTSMTNGNVNELLFGAGLRKMGKKVNLGAEVIYSNQKDYLEIGANIEVLLINNILLAVNIGNSSQDMGNENNQLMIKPTLKYNISQ